MKFLEPRQSELKVEPVAIKARTALRLEDKAGARLTCLKGTVWITQANDQRDIVLSAGQTFRLDRPGLAIAFALADAVITVGAAPSVPLVGRALAQTAEQLSA